MTDATTLATTLATTITAAEDLRAPVGAPDVPTRGALAGRLDALLDELGVWTYTPAEIGGVTVGACAVTARYSQGGSGIGGCTRRHPRYLLNGALLRVGLVEDFLDDKGNWQSLDGWDVDGDMPGLASLASMQAVVDGLAAWVAANREARERLDRSLVAAGE